MHFMPVKVICDLAWFGTAPNLSSNLIDLAPHQVCSTATPPGFRLARESPPILICCNSQEKAAPTMKS